MSIVRISSSASSASVPAPAPRPPLATLREVLLDSSSSAPPLPPPPPRRGRTAGPVARHKPRGTHRTSRPTCQEVSEAVCLEGGLCSQSEMSPSPPPSLCSKGLKTLLAQGTQAYDAPYVASSTGSTTAACTTPSATAMRTPAAQHAAHRGAQTSEPAAL